MTSNTTERSETHGTFVIERNYAAPIASVWHAITDTDARQHWFGGGPDFDVHEQAHDFRVGGRATEAGQWRGGPTSRFESVYVDIVEGRRVVFTYEMWVNGAHLSTSLTTIVLEPEHDSTRLTYTEQAVHYDGLDSIEGREEGTRGLLANLATYLEDGR
jgi:uncharacterized protein YndB with AHSA1/START domain